MSTIASKQMKHKYRRKYLKFFFITRPSTRLRQNKYVHSRRWLMKNRFSLQSYPFANSSTICKSRKIPLNINVLHAIWWQAITSYQTVFFPLSYKCFNILNFYVVSANRYSVSACYRLPKSFEKEKQVRDVRSGYFISHSKDIVDSDHH